MMITVDEWKKGVFRNNFVCSLCVRCLDCPLSTYEGGNNMCLNELREKNLTGKLIKGDNPSFKKFIKSLYDELENIRKNIELIEKL